jgi:hypothetical protein
MATRKTEPDVPEDAVDAVDESPEPMRHPAAPDYVLQEGQWVLEGEHGPELVNMPPGDTVESEE